MGLGSPLSNTKTEGVPAEVTTPLASIAPLAKSAVFAVVEKAVIAPLAIMQELAWVAKAAVSEKPAYIFVHAEPVHTFK